MKKETYDIDIFCDSQQVLAQYLEEKHLLKINKTYGLVDPILTDKYNGTRIEVTTSHLYREVLEWTLGHVIDPDGMDKINRLIDRGLIGGSPKQDSSKLYGWIIEYFILKMLGYSATPKIRMSMTSRGDLIFCDNPASLHRSDEMVCPSLLQGRSF